MSTIEQGNSLKTLDFHLQIINRHNAILEKTGSLLAHRHANLLTRDVAGCRVPQGLDFETWDFHSVRPTDRLSSIAGRVRRCSTNQKKWVPRPSSAWAGFINQDRNAPVNDKKCNPKNRSIIAETSMNTGDSQQHQREFSAPHPPPVYSFISPRHSHQPSTSIPPGIGWQRGHQYVARASTPCSLRRISSPQRRHG